jgi:3-dehydroquinate dehydratase-2
MSKILVLSGPNLHLLGTREPEIYGRTTLAEIHDMLRALAAERGSTIDARQSNHEGELADWIGEAAGRFDGLLINPGALAHSSIVLSDAIAGTGLPAVEVHISNVFARELFRRNLVVAPAARGVISGFGVASYRLGLEALLEIIASEGRRD